MGTTLKVYAIINRRPTDGPQRRNNMTNELNTAWAKNNKLIRQGIAERMEKRAYCDLLVDYDFLIENLLDNSGMSWGDIYTIDDGDCQGTLLYVFAEKVYQPSSRHYYWTEVEYGSCSHCDTLEQALEEEYEEALDMYMSITLHMLQKIKPLLKGATS